MNKESKQMNSLNQYYEISTCMGVTDWYFEKNIIGKTFWAVLIIAGLSITIFQTYGTIAQYISEEPYETKVSQQMIESGIPFPSVTVCNFNRAKQSVVERNGLNPKVLVYLYQLFPTSYDFPLWMDKSVNTTEYEIIWKNYTNNGGDRDIGKILKIYGHTVEETFVFIDAGGQIFIPNDILEILTVYGRCWKLVPNFHQSVPGVFSGFKMFLNPKLNEYTKGVLFNNYFQQGFAIALNYVDEPLMSDSITVAPGLTANIAIKAVVNKINDAQFPMRPRRCNSNPVLQIIKANYTPQNCIYDCYMMSIQKKCGCILLAEAQESKYNKFRFCNLTEALKCATANPFARNLTGQMLMWDNDVYFGTMNCSKRCRNPCYDFWSVTATTTTTNHRIADRKNAIEILTNLGNNWTQTDVNSYLDESILVKIYFTSADVVVLSTGETTEIMTFICNIGGQLGLWMGISMFSIVQVFYYLLVGCLKGDYCGKR